jgi:dTDP-4-dehydrorhamnose 3,5-epimerase
MPFTKTEIPDVLIFEPKIFEDNRGYFFEGYNRRIFEEAGIRNDFIQDNQSFSYRGVLRGLHYQMRPYAQAKIVRVLDGMVLDVAVDIRKGSPYYGKWAAVELSGDNRRQLFIPRGFAHGFVVMSKTAIFFYKCDNYYNHSSEAGINYSDPELKIDWKIKPGELIISEKDASLPILTNASNNFIYGEEL